MVPDIIISQPMILFYGDNQPDIIMYLQTMEQRIIFINALLPAHQDLISHQIMELDFIIHPHSIV
jgi:hypothetical protein